MYIIICDYLIAMLFTGPSAMIYTHIQSISTTPKQWDLDSGPISVVTNNNASMGTCLGAPVHTRV